jgi:phosphopantetheinyl transferase (holo-ACP synthase)
LPRVPCTNVASIAEHVPSASLRAGVDLVRVAGVTASIARFDARYAERLLAPEERAYRRSLT